MPLGDLEGVAIQERCDLRGLEDAALGCAWGPRRGPERGAFGRQGIASLASHLRGPETQEELLRGEEDPAMT
eukprot:839253-Pyramimonas_sp.AAC.1